MSSKFVTENLNDFYGLWKGYTDSIYTYVEKTIPQYHQSISNLYQEYLEICKNLACSAIDIQRGFATKAGIQASMPDAVIKIASDTKQESKTAIDVQNKITIASIDATKQSLNTLNANANEFVAINKNIIEMLPTMTQARSS